MDQDRTGFGAIGPNEQRDFGVHANFSRHAYERVIERLSMEPDEVADLLDWNLAVMVGEEKMTRRIHRIFYSHEDNQCFVAVQDNRTKTVVTILPVDYYENLAARIPQSLLEEAKRLVSCQFEADQQKAPKAVCDAISRSKDPVVFRICGTFLNLQRKPRTVNLGSWPSVNHRGSIARLLQDSSFFKEMQSRLSERKKPEEYAVGLVIRLGKKGEAVWVNLEDDHSDQIRPKAEDRT